MEFIYNSNKNNAGFKSYILDGICSKIVDNNHEITNDDIRILYQLYGQTLLKALDLIDKGCVELITISDSDRQYFSVQGSNSFYTLYLRVNFCECFMFKFSVEKKEKNIICKHILACHLALAMGKYKTRSATSFVITDATEEKPD